jgi:hypothetical protein
VTNQTYALIDKGYSTDEAKVGAVMNCSAEIDLADREEKARAPQVEHMDPKLDPKDKITKPSEEAYTLCGGKDVPGCERFLRGQ